MDGWIDEPTTRAKCVVSITTYNILYIISHPSSEVGSCGWI
jgi:hypothetical protein